MPYSSQPQREAALVKSGALSACRARGIPQTGQTQPEARALSQSSFGRTACVRHWATEVEEGASGDA
jgi:hypothetical protein